MNKEITTRQMCVVMRNGIEIWTDEKKGQELVIKLENIETHCFFTLDGRSLNTADCTGVYYPEDMEDMKWRKNGYWKCQNGKYHAKGDLCDCSRIPRDSAPDQKPTKVNFKSREKSLNKVRKDLQKKGILKK